MDHECRHTNHMATSEFLSALNDTPAGGSFIYARGDFMYSLDTARNCVGSSDLRALSRLVWERFDRKEIWLTQRRLPHVGLSSKHAGGSFEYIATKRSSNGRHYKPSA